MEKTGPPTNPATTPPQKFLLLLRYNLYLDDYRGIARSSFQETVPRKIAENTKIVMAVLVRQPPTTVMVVKV